MFFDPNPAKAIFLAEVDSTNRYLLEGDFPSGTSCLADFQTAGRGRKGRSWLAQPGEAFLYSGLLESRLLKGPSHLLFRRPSFLPLLAGLALREAVLDFVDQRQGSADAKALASRLQIKWPNDLVYQPSGESAPSSVKAKKEFWGKLAGVLVESREQKDRVRLVIGIGLNWRGRPPSPFQKQDAKQGTTAEAAQEPDRVRAMPKAEGPSQSAPKRVSLPPISLFPETEQSPKEFLPFLLACLNQKLRLYYEGADAQILKEIRMNFYLKNRLYLHRGRMHRVRGLSEDGRLLIEDDNGRVLAIHEAE